MIFVILLVLIYVLCIWMGLLVVCGVDVCVHVCESGCDWRVYMWVRCGVCGWWWVGEIRETFMDCDYVCVCNYVNIDKYIRRYILLVYVLVYA
jgi:hypothetical protein